MKVGGAKRQLRILEEPESGEVESREVAQRKLFWETARGNRQGEVVDGREWPKRISVYW